MSQDHPEREEPRRSPWAVLNWPAIGLILAYRATLSPLVGGHCRFHPSCSIYALEAYRRHNPIRATGLTLWRLLRCHPFGGSGVDPVPRYRRRPWSGTGRGRVPRRVCGGMRDEPS